MSARSSHGVALVAFALATLGASSAHANGRFPDALQLVVAPNDESHIAVQTTYGFIHTRDHGARWTWTCEDAAFYSGVLDPPIALMESGALIAGVFDGLVQSSPDACDWSLLGGDLATRFFVDVSTIKQAPSHAIALASNGKGMNTFDTQVFATTDNGATWAKRGAALPTNFLGLTLDAASDDEDLLYLSGFEVLSSSNYVGTLAVSSDGGATWELRPIDGSANEAGPYIAAIDPVDHDTLYVRLASLEGRLLVTHDAGASWTQIYQAPDKLLGFALSPDGSEVRVGGPDSGLFGSKTDAFDFQKVNEVGVRCLTWTTGGLYVCAREAFAEYTVGESQDKGTTFTPLHHLYCLDGPDASCAADSNVQSICAGPWAAQKQLLGTDQCGAGGAGTGGAGGAGAGGAGAGGSDDGCSCATSGDRDTRNAGLWFGLFALGVAARRGRRRAAAHAR